MKRGEDIAKVGWALIGMDKEHRKRDFILDTIKNRKPMEAVARAEVTRSRARRPLTNRAAAF